MDELRVIVYTDWWIIGATVLSGVIAAIATIIAVLITNAETRKQLLAQKEQYDKQAIDKNKKEKYVVIQPTLMLTSFASILDRLVVQNNYNRELLLSGDDGFEFYDDINKRNNQLCRILHLENDSTNDIVGIILNTNTRLENNDTNEIVFYSTHNVINLLRAKESIDIRIANQEQFEKIVRMNQGKISSELVFDCKIEYFTQAKQQVTYRYQTRIINDKRIDILEDGVEQVVDDVTTTNEKSTPFRNLQDEISTIDRNSYAWEKMTRTMLTVMEQSGLHQFKNNESKLMTSNSAENTVNPEKAV